MSKPIIITALTLVAQCAWAQIVEQDSIHKRNEILDSLFIAEVEHVKGQRDKVLHAEPLFIDLIRDLGARKGEKEWNVGLGMVDRTTFDGYTALVEYEFAPVDRLGLEIELPFSFYYKPDTVAAPLPPSRLNSLKLAAQYTFLVNEKISTSLAFGYIHEFELTSFSQYGKENLLTGNLYNPFMIAAKRWGNDFHTLVYAGPIFSHHLGDDTKHTLWQVNTNFHYMISGTRNFIGIEFNKEFTSRDFDMVIRPQMRLGITDKVLIGIVTGIPISRETQRFSTFLRLIYEPGAVHK